MKTPIFTTLSAYGPAAVKFKGCSLPSEVDLETLPKDSHVKVGVESSTSGAKEIFWALVDSYEIDGSINCIVDNELVRTSYHGLSCGDKIQISKENILLVLL